MATAHIFHTKTADLSQSDTGTLKTTKSRENTILLFDSKTLTVAIYLTHDDVRELALQIAEQLIDTRRAN